MSFHAVRFPLPLSFGARGGPERKTDIVQLASGHEQRNTPFSQSRRRYDAGAGVTSLDDLHTLISFYEARRGQLYGFLFRDPMDHKSCAPSQSVSASDQIVGYGDGIKTHFALTKTYEDSVGDYIRRIDYPRVETLRVAVSGAPFITGYDSTARQIVFDTPPVNGAQITAGFEFDVPVRFDTDQLDLALEAFGAGRAANIPLIEVKPYA